MAKITRKKAEIFGGTAPAAAYGIAKFGSLAEGTPTFSTDPDVIQSAQAWEEGWQSASVADDSPALEDRNAVDYVHSRQIAYLLQQGIPEWLSTETYYKNAYVVDSNGDLRVSVIDNNTGHDPLLDQGGQYWGFGGGAGGGKSIGEVFWSQSSSASDNAGALPLFTGETIASADTVYPEFYTWVADHADLQISAADYNTAITTYGECPKYVIDTVNKTIRLPLLKNYIKNANTVDGITQAEAGLPNITGTWDAYKVGNAGGGSATGALKISGGTQRGSAANESASNTKLKLDASESNGIYGNSTTVTPSHTTLFPWVCAYNAAVEASVAQAAEFQNALTGKLDTDLDNIANAGKDAIVNMCMPDYANVVTVGPINAGTWTQVAKDSFVVVRASDPYTADAYLYVSPDNGTTTYAVGWWYNNINSATKGSSWSFFVPKGWYFTSEVENAYTAYIYPLKGAQ